MHAETGGCELSSLEKKQIVYCVISFPDCEQFLVKYLQLRSHEQRSSI